ncbi:uncharacterized protein LOC115445396 [Manduca sexta]|uniref:Nucleolus and neural progenitor protein-like N-terminal domain-containing protein n=1 Tax=Manduca sexta TaxID=7130 RepID=A0A921ZAA5_MANSE|nr:uncharacterized protein LOC115445396 [Manduca sexta]KAG6453062.1 hypothetical protein O3G_MSEX007948 [Manduca sexta]
MLEPWNDASLLPPPIHTATSTVRVDVMELKHTCENIMMILSKQSPLHKEGALLSRFLYKFDKKFRGDIGYRYFKKVNTGLHRYLVLNFLKDIESFMSVLPRSDDEYLPTRQMLEYILVRLLTFSKILLRISVCSKQAAVFYLDRLKRGESYWMCLMPYALLSRVWSISKVLLNHSTRWYRILYSYLDKLKLQGLQFLPSQYKLPGDIEIWLDLKNVDNLGRLEWSQKKLHNLNIPLDGDSDMFDNIIKFVETSEEKLEPEVASTSGNMHDSDQIKISSKLETDHGEAISRESFNILCNLQKGIVSDHFFPKVYNRYSLQKFIDKESDLRNGNSRLSLTSHLSFMQWQVLKESLSKLCKSSADNSKIEKKAQRIWKDKCLDYLE